jgi:hypothetical protein
MRNGDNPNVPLVASTSLRAEPECEDLPHLSGSIRTFDISSSQLVAECVAKVSANNGEDSDEDNLNNGTIDMISMNRMDKPATKNTFLAKRRELPILRSDDDDSDR